MDLFLRWSRFGNLVHKNLREKVSRQGCSIDYEVLSQTPLHSSATNRGKETLHQRFNIGFVSFHCIGVFLLAPAFEPSLTTHTKKSISRQCPHRRLPHTSLTVYDSPQCERPPNTSLCTLQCLNRLNLGTRVYLNPTSFLKILLGLKRGTQNFAKKSLKEVSPLTLLTHYSQLRSLSVNEMFCYFFCLFFVFFILLFCPSSVIFGEKEMTAQPTFTEH